MFVVVVSAEHFFRISFGIMTFSQISLKMVIIMATFAQVQDLV